MVTLYAKGTADSGSSVFRHIEREALLSARPDAVIPLRDAAAVLREIGIDRHTLLKIDIEGAEYEVLRADRAAAGECEAVAARVVPSVQPGGAGDAYRQRAAAAAVGAERGGSAGAVSLHAFV